MGNASYNIHYATSAEATKKRRRNRKPFDIIVQAHMQHCILHKSRKSCDVIMKTKSKHLLIKWINEVWHY